MVLLVIATIAGTFAWDRFCTYLFAPAVFKAMISEAAKTTFADLVPVMMTLLKIIGGLLLLGSGNILIWGLAYYWYRYYYVKKPAPVK